MTLITDSMEYFYIYWSQIQTGCLQIKKQINESVSDIEPLYLILCTMGVTFIICQLWDIFNDEDDVLDRVKRRVYSVLKKLPILRNIVAEEMEKAITKIRNNTKALMGNPSYLQYLPKEGWTKEQIVKEVEKYQNLSKVKWKEGRASGTVYSSSDSEVQELLTTVFDMTAWSNPLHPDVFPNVIKMEAEIVKMVCNLFHAKDEACGMVTSGGTESILLACKAYRDYARYEKGIKHPEMIVPVTAHAAFEKAASLLRIRIKRIPFHPKTMEVDVKAMQRAISRNTCLLVGSAPPYPHGVMDSIEDIAKLGSKYNVPVHVDACLGGFLIPFMESAGFDIPLFDFRLPGVTSISADTHKYAYAPKGSSVIMYSNVIFLHYQYSIETDWPGGVYITPNLSGSRAGSNIATCWAVMMYYGYDGYIECTRKIITTTRYIEKGLRNIPGIHIYGKPQVSVISIGSTVFDIFRLISTLTDLGWNINNLQYPSGFHLCVTLQHTKDGVADAFINDVKKCTEAIMKDPKSSATGMAAMYGVAQSIPDRSIVAQLAAAFIDCCYDINEKE